MSDTEKSGFIILHYGPMGIEAMAKATKLAGENAVIGTDAARMAGASFAFGSAELLQALQDRLAPGAEATIATKYPQLSEAARTWLATGERGASSDAIFSHLSGLNLGKRNASAHPYDTSDLRRCRLLLAAVPEFAPRIVEMADVSQTWARLVARWDELCATMDASGAQSQETTKDTYALMQEILKGS